MDASLSDQQLWILKGTKPHQKLLNKGKLWKSPHNWQFHDDQAVRTIEDLTRKQVLGVQDGTNLVFLEAGETWEKKKFSETQFTLEVLSLALTKNSAGEIIEGRINLPS